MNTLCIPFYNAYIYIYINDKSSAESCVVDIKLDISLIRVHVATPALL